MGLTFETSQSLQVIAGVVGFCAYIRLALGIWQNKAEQSFAAFFLWGMLDTIAMVTIILQGGNFWLALSNVVGSSTIALLLIIKKQVSWSWIETTTSVLVIICLTIWYTVGERAGIISSSLAVVIASVPQMVDTYKNPAATPLIAYLIFLTANILSFTAGHDWSIEERFYAGCSLFLCLVIVLFSRRRKGRE
ncbi:MAG TPA: hypothetical protein VK666_16345 [Chryseolinea sp.]|nr:hypothetical protein [Chryseolinea sp.]